MCHAENWDHAVSRRTPACRKVSAGPLVVPPPNAQAGMYAISRHLRRCGFLRFCTRAGIHSSGASIPARANRGKPNRDAADRRIAWISLIRLRTLSAGPRHLDKQGLKLAPAVPVSNAPKTATHTHAQCSKTSVQTKQHANEFRCKNDKKKRRKANSIKS